MPAKDFFNAKEKKEIVDTIRKAETLTSGEIRVHIEDKCKDEVLDRAAFIFKKLEMHKTELRNGVLFYFAVKDKKFAILGDVGINQTVPENFWDNIKENIILNFKEDNYKKGLIDGIIMVGEQLRKYFPYNKDTDVNEISDEISY
ncbi:MAG: hypothetical protein A2X12_04385 [Bacteroidetes bacterium GWE2_29_8]|nr:MAG: hypothetical protein A2X12_04385 [Bacteroidetes bacterium GWE2_29_8]OFY18043.1 MAG: hypothetical protein A2X02_09765 [Bacteroidetes bacterium GWF2_29_10]